MAQNSRFPDLPARMRGLPVDHRGYGIERLRRELAAAGLEDRSAATLRPG
jgi:hypothetical protein